MRDILGLSGGIIIGLGAMIFQPLSPYWWTTLAIAAFIFLGSAAHLLHREILPTLPRLSLWRSARETTRAEQCRAPIHEIIAHVARRIGDNDARMFSPAARQEIRQAALDGRIGFSGFRSEKLLHENERSGTAWHSARTSIPSDYWTNAEISVLAAEPQFARDFGLHTFPQKLSNGKYTRENIYLYARVVANWDEVRRLWP